FDLVYDAQSVRVRLVLRRLLPVVEHRAALPLQTHKLRVRLVQSLQLPVQVDLAVARDLHLQNARARAHQRRTPLAARRARREQHDEREGEPRTLAWPIRRQYKCPAGRLVNIKARRTPSHSAPARSALAPDFSTEPSSWSKRSTARRRCGIVIEPPTTSATLKASKNSSRVTPTE